MKKRFKRLSAVFAIILLCLGVSGCGDWISNPQVNAVQLENQLRNCWTCAMFDNLFQAFGGYESNNADDEGLIARTYKNTARGARNLLLIGFALWMALKVMHLMVSPGDLPGFLSQLLKKLLFVFIGTVILSAPETINLLARYVVFPIFSLFVGIAVSVLETLESQGEGGLACLTSAQTWEMGDSFNQFKDPLRCFLQMVSGKLALIGVQAQKLKNVQDYGIGGYLCGWIAWIFYLLVDAVLALSILDSIFTFGIVMMLAPLLLVSWIFEITRKYTKAAFNMLVGAASQCAVVSIFVSFSVLAFDSFLKATDRVVTAVGIEENTTNIALEAVTFKEDGWMWIFMAMVLFLFLGLFKLNEMVGGIIGSKSSMFTSVVKQMVTIAGVAGLTVVTMGSAGVKYAATKGGKQLAKGAAAAATKEGNHTET